MPIIQKLACLSALSVSLLTAASLSGTWRLDPARSRLDPPTRLTWEPVGPKNYKHTSPSFNGIAWPVDGTAVPSPAEEGIMVTRKRLSDRIIQETRTRGGKPISNVIRTVSPDGRRLTITGSGVNAEGEKFDYTTPYNRVGTAGKDPLAGTWEEDFFAQAREAILLTISDTPKEFRVSGKGYSWAAPFTGMQSPIRLPWADQAHVERLGPAHVKAQLTKASRVTREEEYKLSVDGQTLTIRRKLPGAKPARGFIETYVRSR